MSLWADGENQSEKRRNRESLPLRLLHPAYDIAEGGSVTATPKAVDGDDIIGSFETRYAAGAGINVAIVHNITICNNDTVSNQVNVYLVQSGGAASSQNAIFFDDVQPGETVTLSGPWFLDPSDVIASYSPTASANEVAFRAEVMELSSAVPGVTLKVVDSAALGSASLDLKYTCPSSGVQHANIIAITLCNTDTVAQSATVEIRPSGGSTSAKQYIFNGSLDTRTSVILCGPNAPIVLEPGDTVYAKASASPVMAFRITLVEYATS